MPIRQSRLLAWTAASAREMMTGRKGICEKAQAQGRQLVHGGHVVAETAIDVVIPGRFCASDGDVMLLATAQQRPTVRCLATSR